ncbi:MAG: hypothetical protein NTW86_32120 [Candidatus Sumerlaeota bacterium]|nr:hypothetical protein [Candidatus Sumerlaeota bacterium]
MRTPNLHSLKAVKPGLALLLAGAVGLAAAAQNPDATRGRPSDRLLQLAGVGPGLCAVVGDSSGEIALELARRTEA